MQRVFGQLVDRTRARLDVPTVRTIFGAKNRPHRNRTSTWRVEAVVATPRYDLTVFKAPLREPDIEGVHQRRPRPAFARPLVHNTKDLGCGRVLDRFCEIVARLRILLERFLTVLDCVDAAFIADHTLDQLPLGCQVGKTRVGGVDLNKPRIRAVLHGVLALAASPAGFTAAQLAGKVQAMTGRGCTPRQAAYDLQETARQGSAGQTRQHPALPHPTPGHPCHHRPDRPARPGDRSHPRWRPHPQTRTQTQQLERHRPALRDPASGHEGPPGRLRHRRVTRQHIDNFLSITLFQAPSAGRGRAPPPRASCTACPGLR